METPQPDLFEAAELPSLLPVGVAGSGKALTPAQRRFNKLVAEIERARTELAEWQAAASEGRASAAAALPPRQAELRALQRRMVLRLDALLGAAVPKLTRRRREAVRHALVDLVGEMLEEGPDDELAAVHDRHADLTLAEQAQFDADMAREMLGQMLGQDVLPDAEDASLDEVLRAAHAHLNEQAQAEQQAEQRKAQRRAERRRAQGKGPTRQEQLAHARQQAGQSLREVYRKLASALHPDRAPGPEEQARCTALMQRANQAYDAQDLLGLLSLQIEVEQIDAAHLAGLADERVQHYNLVLQEQLDTLQGEVIECMRGLGLHRRGTRRPREIVREALAADLAGIESTCTRLRADLAALEDPKRCLPAIDGWVAAERDAELPDLDIAMLGAMMGAGPPRRRRRR